jgi:hypothetical protein
MSIKFSRDAYELEDDSDQERAESSDDDINTFLQNTLQQHKRLRRHSFGHKSSSEDEFEKEMAAELNSTMKKIEADHGVESNNAPSTAIAGEMSERCYDNEYFDSDSDDEGTSEEKKKVKHPIPSNDDLLYDPEMDDEDQKWVDKQRRLYQPETRGGHVKPLPTSDAVLNCPGCMSLLCMDCQRHTVYQHQYRAMFVTNCTVRYDQKLHYPNPPAKNAKRKGKTAAKAAPSSAAKEGAGVDCTALATGSSNAASDEIFHPVVCSICNSEVGVYDQDEVYHFFNILTSHT